MKTKKLLLATAVLATAISSFNFVPKSFDKGLKDGVNQEIEKLGKRNLDVADANYSLSNINQMSLAETTENIVADSAKTIAAEEVSVASASEIANDRSGSMAEHIEGIDISEKVDSSIYDKIKPEIITGPVLDHNTGGGSSSGGSSSGQTLKRFVENELQYDDFSYYAQAVDNQGILTGAVRVHTNSELEYLKNVGFASKVDKDWFRFTVEERLFYSFNFSAPNSGYYFDLYRFSETRFGGLHANDQTHTLVKSSKTDGNSFSGVFLEPATYFICVTAKSESYIGSYNTYELTYTYEKDTEGTETITFNGETISNYPVIVWEHDKKPYQINRWDGDDQPMLVYRPYYDGVHSVFEGYLDPLFTENKNWKPANSDYGFECHNLYLDSVTYLNSVDAIKDFVKVIDGMREEMSRKALLEEKNNYIESVKIKQEKMWNAGKGVFEYIISPYLDLLEDVPYLGTVIKLGRYVVEAFEVAQTIKDALEYEVIDYDMYSATPYHLGSNLREMSTDAHLIADGMANNYFANNYIFRIPKFSYLHCSTPNFYENEFGEFVESPKVYRWISTNMISVEYPTFYFLQGKGTKANAIQTDPVISGGTVSFKGRFKKFTSFSQYSNYTNYNKNTRSGRFMSYDLYKSGSKYYMDVYNPTNMGHLFTYNTENQVNENQSKLFNFKANSYASEGVNPKRRVTVCLDGRNYAWVRENWNDYVFKVYLKNNQVIIEGDGQDDNGVEDTFIEFGMPFMKLAIVKKNGLTPWGSWVIRIWNLTNRNLQVYYNKKMCFDADAMYWSGLNDLDSNYILYNGYQDVTISENWGATTIAVSYTFDGKRYVSYANLLNASAKTLSYHTKVARP